MSERVKITPKPVEASQLHQPRRGEFVPDLSGAHSDKGKPAKDIRTLLLGGPDGITLLTPPRVESLQTRVTYRRSGEGPMGATINTCNDTCTPASCDDLCPPNTGSDCNGKDC